MSQKKKGATKKATTGKAQPKTKELIPQDSASIGRGRPKQSGDMKKITLTVSHDQIIWLDRLATDIRDASRVIIDRGAIIRSLIAALESSKLNLTNCTSERDVLEIITRKLKE